MAILEVEAGEKDPRVEFLADFTLKSLRLKSDKWARLLISDEMRTYISRFIDHTVPQVDFERQADNPAYGLISKDPGQCNT